MFNQQPTYEKSLSIHGEALEIELAQNVFIDLHPMTIEELNLNYIFFDEVKKGLYYGAR